MLESLIKVRSKEYRVCNQIGLKTLQTTIIRRITNRKSIGQQRKKEDLPSQRKKVSQYIAQLDASNSMPIQTTVQQKPKKRFKINNKTHQDNHLSKSCSPMKPRRREIRFLSR
jgi:hypothetical protein